MTERQRAGSATTLTRLTAVSRALTYAVSLDEVLDITVECAADMLEADRVVLMMSDEDQMLRIRASRGVEPEAVEAFAEPLDERLITKLSGVLGPDVAGSFLGVPLVVRGGVTGLLAVAGRVGEAPTERDEWLLSALADQASVAIESAQGQRTREAMESRFRELERAGGHRDDALRMIGHDLKSPLSALNGYLHLLGSESYGPMNDAQIATVERLTAITAHVSAMVDSVLDMGRLASGSLDLQSAPLELAPVIRDAVTVLGVAPEERGVAVVTDVPAGLEAIAHRDRLRQVLVHLADNAVKHAPPDTEVRLAARAEGDRVVIRVSDLGPGIPPDQAEEIFEPYRQLDGASGGGMGLGLAIARGLVERMGGEVVLDTDVEEGATFVVRLRAG